MLNGMVFVFVLFLVICVCRKFRVVCLLWWLVSIVLLICMVMGSSMMLCCWMKFGGRLYVELIMILMCILCFF